MGKDIERKKLKVDILTPIRFGGPQKWGDDLVRALKNEGIESKNIHNFWGIVKRFFWTDADVIHSGGLPLFFNLQGKPIVLTIKGDYQREKHLWDFVWPLAIRRAKTITVPSEFLKKEIGLKEAVVIPNGIFPEDYKPVKHKKKNILQIVTVTGFSFWDKARGIIELLKILEDVKKRSEQKFEFTIVGDGPYLEQIKEESKKFDVPVKFIGFHPDPKEILEKSDIFVYYSFHDNQPNTILQAMACGLPVVSNDVGAVREIKKNHKGFYMPRKKSEFIKEIIKMIKDLNQRNKSGFNLRKSVEIDYSFKEIIKSFIGIYKNEL